jgi:hypothetical protein
VCLTVGWKCDRRLALAIAGAKPSIRIAFVGPPVSTSPDKALNECPVLDFICHRKFDHSVVEFAKGKPLNKILGISYQLNGKIVHNPDRPQVKNPALRHIILILCHFWFRLRLGKERGMTLTAKFTVNG